MDAQEVQKLVDISNHLFVETSLFTTGLGLVVRTMEAEKASMAFSNRADLTGSERTQNLHGGVIASVLDITGSLVIFSNLLFRMKSGTVEERIKKITRINTIDLRVDYLRPGIGTDFVATGYILRTGRTVGVSRIELHNAEGRLVSVGTGSYIISVK